MGEELVRKEHPIEAIERMGQYIAKSGFFGVKTPEQAIALMLIAQAEGRHPASAAQDYHVIQNRPALKADTMLARFQQAGGVVQWEEYTDTRVAATFSHLQGGKVTVDWDMDRAKRAGLGSKGNWKNYPRAMLRARVISEGIRTVYPAVLGGMYTPEEVSDMPPIEVMPEPEKTKAAKKPKAESPLVIHALTSSDIEASFADLCKGQGIPIALAEEYMEQRALISEGETSTTSSSSYVASITDLKTRAINNPQGFRRAIDKWAKDQQTGPEIVDQDTAGVDPA